MVVVIAGGVASSLRVARRELGGALAAVRGAVGFLTRVPIGTDEAAWTAFASRPAAMVAVGYLVGTGLALVLAPGLPAATVAVLVPAWLYALTGITHLDGVADCGDAAVVHGDRQRRLTVLSDTTTGVGAIAGVALVVAGLAFAGLALADRPLATAAVAIVAAEVGAKLGMVVVAVFGTAAHGGMGAQFTGAGAGTLAAGGVLATPTLAVPTLLLGPDAGGVAVAALAGGPVAAVLALWWARRTLGGVTGDVFGAANEVGRVLGLHAALALAGWSADATPLPPEVIAWTLS